MTQMDKPKDITARVESLKLSELSGSIEVVPTHREKLQAQTLSPVVTFFIRANTAVGIGVFLLAGIELLLPPSHTPIVTEKVIITLIGGLTVQVGAVIIAAFKGLFDHRAASFSRSRPSAARSRRSQAAVEVTPE
jgi:hypothetical protein